MKLPKSPKFMFSRPFIIYNSILLVFKPNNPNLFMHLLFPVFLPRVRCSRSRAEGGNATTLQVTLPSWEQPQGSEALANACNEQRSSQALPEEQISPEAAVEPHVLYKHYTTPAPCPAVPWPMPHFPKASQLQSQLTS